MQYLWMACAYEGDIVLVDQERHKVWTIYDNCCFTAPELDFNPEVYRLVGWEDICPLVFRNQKEQA